MTYPTKEKANEYLAFSKKSMLEQGTPPEAADFYEEHCRVTAKAVKLMASRFDNLDLDKIEVMGLLHDVGKYQRENIVKRNHGISGYEFMMQEGYPEIARICLTHLFPAKHFSAASYDFMFGKEDDINFTRDYLEVAEYTHYDELIQLADIMSMPQGFVTIEQRYNDILERYKRDDMLENLPIYINLKEKIDKHIGEDVYNILGINA